MKTKIITETDRLVVEFASLVGGHDVYPIGIESQVWLVREQHAFDQPPMWRLMSPRMEWTYALVSSLCNNEAVQAELNNRLDQGRHVKAEAYIGLWRKAMEQRIPATELSRRGLSLEVSFTNSTQYLLEARGEFKAKAMAALESVFLKTRDDTQCSWQITLDSLEACQAYSMLNRLRSYGEVHGPMYSEIWRLVQETGWATAAAVAQPAYDLFCGVEVAA